MEPQGAVWPGRGPPPPHIASVISLFHVTAFLHSSCGIKNLGNCCQNCCFSGECLRSFQYQGLRPVTTCSNSGCANWNSHKGLLLYLLFVICDKPAALHQRKPLSFLEAVCGVGAMWTRFSLSFWCLIISPSALGLS